MRIGMMNMTYSEPTLLSKPLSMNQWRRQKLKELATIILQESYQIIKVLNFRVYSNHYLDFRLLLISNKSQIKVGFILIPQKHPSERSNKKK